MIHVAKRMMQRTKTFVAMLVVAMMLALCAAPAMADPLPPATGNLYIHKYIGGATGGVNDGTEIPGGVAGIAVNGVVFNLYKVDTSTTAGTPDGGMTYVLSGTDLEVYDGTVLKGTYPVAPAATSTVTTGATGIAGTAVALNLPQGLYLVIEDTAASTNITNAATNEDMFISSTMAPFLVAVPMTDPTGTGWLTDVHVYPKNEALSIEKIVDTSGAVAVGDVVGYTITVSIPNDIKDAKKFDIIDTMDEALDVDLTSVVTKTLPIDVGLVANTDYTVTYNTTTRALLISFSSVGLAKLDGFAFTEVSFSAVVNNELLNKPDFSVSNEAAVNFTNANDVDFEADTGGTGPVIYTSAIEITKIDQTGVALSGARFKIATSEAKAKASEFLRIDPTTQIIYDSGDAGYNSAGVVDYEISPANQDSFTGLIDATGTAPNLTYNTYWVVETVAPAGYNMLSAPVAVTFDGTEVGHTYLLEVTNNQGFTLPLTGGAGTIVFTVVGIVLLGLAAIVFVSFRKREKDNTAI